MSYQSYAYDGDKRSTDARIDGGVTELAVLLEWGDDSDPELEAAEDLGESAALVYDMMKRKLLAEWPEQCQTCWGSGVIEEPGITYRDGTRDPSDANPCPDCEGRCPRCAFGGWELYADERGEYADAYEAFTAGDRSCPGCDFRVDA